MNGVLTVKLAKELRDLYQSSDASRHLFDKFHDFKKDVRMTTAARAGDLASVSYREIIKLFRELDRIRAGNFKSGRRGAQSRIEWRYSVRSLGAAAKGAVGEPTEIDESELDDTESGYGEENIRPEDDWVDWIDHTFQLRHDIRVTIKLPADLNSKEAERLAGFIRQVPFGE